MKGSSPQWSLIPIPLENPYKNEKIQVVLKNHINPILNKNGHM